MTLSHLAIPLLVLPLMVLPEGGPAAPSADFPQQITVMITASGYDPATVTVKHGDVVRFVQADVLAHNIEFHGTPPEARLAPAYPAPVGSLDVFWAASPTARVGPFLLGAGRAYEIRIGEEMPAGLYEFGCSRHGKWRGVMVVTDAEGLE